MGFLVLVVVAAAVIVLVMRAASVQNGSRTTARAPRRVRPPRPQRTGRALPPDDDPEFLRSLDRWTRRDDGTPG